MGHSNIKPNTYNSKLLKLETLWLKQEKLLEIKTPLSSLSYTIAALNPAFSACRTLSSNVHPPLMINTNGGFGPSSTLFVNRVHASWGSARYNTPHSPDPFIVGAGKIEWKHDYVTLQVTIYKHSENDFRRNAVDAQTALHDGQKKLCTSYLTIKNIKTTLTILIYAL